MPYKVLYRKYRPDSFGKIVGQSSIVDILQKSVVEGSFSHAYLFTGPRGTGKTTTAKVLAKALTCEHPIDGEACNECAACKNFTTSPDIIEIDAASNNGVDEIRELRSNITLAPSSLKYKVYIIDEVHMLSTGAFNALLKTLEEPPSHAIFILATTEVYKVPITILSRCQRYDFKKIDKNDMIDHLKYVCKSEGIGFEDNALLEIYELSEGCLRDALSILDQTSKIDKNITEELILKNYNVVSNRAMEELLNYVSTGNIEKVISFIEEFENSGTNAQKLIKRMINFLEKMAIKCTANSTSKFSFSTLSKIIDDLNRCYIDARINENVYTMIKLSFIEMVIRENGDVPKTLNKKGQKESTPKEKAQTGISELPPVSVKSDLSVVEIRINNCFVEVSKEALSNFSEKWDALKKGKMAGIDLKNYKPVAASSTHAIFSAEEDSLAQLFNVKSVEIEKMLKEKGLDIKIVSISNENWLLERERYKNNIKSRKKYIYIEEPAIETELDGQKEIEDLFTEKVVEIS